MTNKPSEPLKTETFVYCNPFEEKLVDLFMDAVPNRFPTLEVVGAKNKTELKNGISESHPTIVWLGNNIRKYTKDKKTLSDVPLSRALDFLFEAEPEYLKSCGIEPYECTLTPEAVIDRWSRLWNFIHDETNTSIPSRERLEMGNARVELIFPEHGKNADQMTKEVQTRYTLFIANKLRRIMAHREDLTHSLAEAGRIIVNYFPSLDKDAQEFILGEIDSIYGRQPGGPGEHLFYVERQEDGTYKTSLMGT